MAEFYAKLVRAGAKTLEQVPAKWREATKRILDGTGLADRREAGSRGPAETEGLRRKSIESGAGA